MTPPFKLVHIRFRTIAVVTALLPLSSFLMCIFYSLMFQFKQVTATHCQPSKRRTTWCCTWSLPRWGGLF
ncbi:unnamed protein product [Ixodes pacificus]